MPRWQPRLLVDEGLPYLRVAKIFPDCDVIRCELQAKDQAIAVMARELNAAIVCSDRDFYGAIRNHWMRNEDHAMGPLRVIHVIWEWSEAELALKRWRDAALALIETMAPLPADRILIEISSLRMYVVSPDMDRPPVGR